LRRPNRYELIQDILIVSTVRAAATAVTDK
jgi:hypothetical protein